MVMELEPITGLKELALYSKSLLGRAHEATTKLSLHQVNEETLKEGLSCYSSKANLDTLFEVVVRRQPT